MRTLRMALAGMTMVALLVGVTGAVVAQEDDAEEVSTAASPVTGRIADGRQDQPYSISNDADRARFRDAVYVDPIEMDDPRLSGTLWQAWSRDALRNTSGGRYGAFGQLISATIEITNDEGSWVGKSRGYIHPETSHMHFQIDLAGTGAYEGYSALLYAKGPSDWDVEGLIFPGPLPDFPGPVEVPAE